MCGRNRTRTWDSGVNCPSNRIIYLMFMGSLPKSIKGCLWAWKWLVETWRWVRTIIEISLWSSYKMKQFSNTVTDALFIVHFCASFWHLGSFPDTSAQSSFSIYGVFCFLFWSPFKLVTPIYVYSSLCIESHLPEVGYFSNVSKQLWSMDPQADKEYKIIQMVWRVRDMKEDRTQRKNRVKTQKHGN